MSRHRFMRHKLLFALLIPILLVGCGSNPDKGGPEDDDIVSISVSTNPRLNYVEGECFDPTGLVIEAQTELGNRNLVEYLNNELDFSFAPSLTTPLTSENTTVSITYQSFTTSLSITVEEKISLNVDFTTAVQTKTTETQFESKFLPNFVYDGVNLVATLTTDGYCEIKQDEQSPLSGKYNEQYLRIGNQAGFGELHLVFNKKLASVEFVARAHMKIYSYRGYDEISADESPILNVNNQSWELTTATIEHHEAETNSFVIDSNELTIKTDDFEKSRVCIFYANFIFEK